MPPVKLRLNLNYNPPP